MDTIISDSHIMELFDTGKTDLFLKSVKDRSVDIWCDEILFYLVEEKCVSATNQRCAQHYDMIKQIIDESIEEHHTLWQDDDLLKRWIYHLVECKYPWFVCSSWNHLRPIAISFLHQASLMYTHFGVLHQLLRHCYIEHMWECDFVGSIMDQSELFCAITKPAHKSFLKQFTQQLNYYPFDDHDAVATTIEALYLQNCAKVLKLFLQHSNSASFWNHNRLIHRACKMCDSDLFDAVYEKRYTQVSPSIDIWWQCFSAIFSDFQGCVSKPKEAKQKCFEMFSHVLDVFEARMDVRNWCSLVLYGEVLFLQLFVRSSFCYTLTQRVWAYFIQSIEANNAATPEDTITYFSYDREYEIPYSTLFTLHQNKTLLTTLNVRFTDKKKWTFVANVIRWCDFKMVEWVRQESDSQMITDSDIYCVSGCTKRQDNPLTLSLYNTDSRILNYIISALQTDKKDDTLRDWISAQSGTSMITALVRLSLFHPQQAHERFAQMYALCPQLLTYKSNLINIVVEEWSCHLHMDTPFSRSHNPFESFASNTLLTTLFELPYQLKAKSMCGILANCENETVFTHTLQTAFTHYRLVEPIDAYLEFVENRNFPHSYLVAFETHPEMETRLRSMRTHQTLVIHHWLIRSDPTEFDAFLYRAKHKWRWNVHKIVSSDLKNLMVEGTQYNVCNLMYDEWYSLISNGLLPLCVYHPYVSRLTFLQRMLSAFRLMRRCLQRRFKRLRAHTTRSRKRLHFIIKCQPEYSTAHKIQRTGVHYSDHFT